MKIDKKNDKTTGKHNFNINSPHHPTSTIASTHQEKKHTPEEDKNNRGTKNITTIKTTWKIQKQEHNTPNSALVRALRSSKETGLKNTPARKTLIKLHGPKKKKKN